MATIEGFIKASYVNVLHRRETKRHRLVIAFRHTHHSMHRTTLARASYNLAITRPPEAVGVL